MTLRSALGFPSAWFRRLHGDERGNLGVLMLMTVWALVSVIGMVWNTGEYATRRRYVQNAADSAAHAGNLWVSRTTNLTASSNMVISENGSAEVILRAVTPTIQSIQGRFDSERKRTLQLLQGNTPGTPERAVPDCEYFEELLGLGAWANNGRGDQRQADLNRLTPGIQQALKQVLPLLPGPEQTRLGVEIPEAVRRNAIALAWLNQTWVGGTNPAAPPNQVRPPGPGVRKTVGDWVESQVRPRLQDILATLDVEQSWLDRFTNQTNPGVNATTPEQLHQFRGEIYDYQQRILALTPKAVEEQRAALAAFYKCDLTYSTPGNPTPSGPAVVQAPLQPSEDVQSQQHLDGIRQKYPRQAQARFGTSDPTVTVDPINVNVGDSIIWHPDVPEDAPPGIILEKQEFTGEFNVGGGEWGQVPCAPLARFFDDRVNRDEQGLRREPQGIDGVRDGLRGRIFPPPPDPWLQALPQQILDVQPKAAPIPIAPEQIPEFPLPAGLKATERDAVVALNARIRQFNEDVHAYVHDLRQLQTPLDAMSDNLYWITNHGSARFADATWLGFVEQNRAYVLEQMGWDKQFLVLKTYDLRPIPDWATSGMWDDAHRYVYQAVYNHDIGPVTRDVKHRIEQWAEKILGVPNGGEKARRDARNEARQFADAYAPPAAQYMVRRAAEVISREVADEWVTRPWPFEIDPPTDPVPPAKGISDDQRKTYFTFLAAAVTTADSAPKTFMPRVFAATDQPMAAFAQGENFNWMEYDGGYGAGDAYDKVTRYGHGDVSGSPKPWRISTVGGWAWQPRLALSDALGQAVEGGQEFSDFLSRGGVSSYDPDAIKTLTLH